MPKTKKSQLQTQHADLEDLQGEIVDMAALATAVLADLRCAESCENIKDFRANLQEAIATLGNLRASLRETLEAATDSSTIEGATSE